MISISPRALKENVHGAGREPCTTLYLTKGRPLYMFFRQLHQMFLESRDIGGNFPAALGEILAAAAGAVHHRGHALGYGRGVHFHVAGMGDDERELILRLGVDEQQRGLEVFLYIVGKPAQLLHLHRARVVKHEARARAVYALG